MQTFKNQFLDYVSTFYTENNAEQNFSIKLKEIHSIKVWEEAVALCKAHQFSPDFSQKAEVAALFHDIGRFEQFKQYGTFSDKQSEDHAELGLKVLKKEGFFNNLPDSDREDIEFAIKFHNKAEVPASEDEGKILLLKILRDADKIDIWRVVTEYYSQDEKSETIELSLPDIPEISQGVIASIERQEIVNFKDVKTLNDFKALQMGWKFDLNFTHSLKVLKERKYLEILRDSMTVPKEAQHLFELINQQ
jgi:putative nucleotidyltransferase with HDIG domain